MADPQNPVPQSDDLSGWTPVQGTQKPIQPQAAEDLSGWTPVQGTQKTAVQPQAAPQTAPAQRVIPQATGIGPRPTGTKSWIDEKLGLPSPTEFGNWLDDVKGDVENGTHATWVGSLLSKMGAKGTSYGVSTGIGQNNPLVGAVETAHGVSAVGAHPVQATNEMISGAGKMLGPLAVTQPEALPFMASAEIAGSTAYKTAKAFGADDDTAELIKNVSGLAVGGGTIKKSHLEGFTEAVNSRLAANQVYDAALKDVSVAAQQAEQAQQAAIQAKAAEAAGTGKPEDTIQARNRASEAAANAQKAQAALKTAADNKAQAAVQVAQAGRQIAKTAQKAKAKGPTPEEIKKSTEDFVKAIPSGPGKSAYTFEGPNSDFSAIRPVLERAHVTADPVDSPQAVVDALESDRVSRDNKVKAAVQKYADEPLALSDANGQPVSVKQRLVEALADDEKIKPGFTAAALKELAREEPFAYNTTDPSVGEADALRKTLNNENRDKLNQSGGARTIAEARETDPEFAMRYELADILRDGVYGKLEEKGVKGARESRQLDASAIRVRNAAERQLKKADVQARGTAEVGPVAKLASKAAKTLGVGGGAALGVATGIPGAPELGAILGGEAGGRVADVLAPGDLTRSELIQRSMKTKHGGDIPTLDTSGAQPSNPPAEALPPAVEPPVNPRENTELHAKLASYFDEAVGDTPYDELEQEFLQRIKDAKRFGATIPPEARKLNLDINNAKVEELQRARGLAEEQVKAREKAKADAEAERLEKEKLGLKTNLATPFESESHISPEDEFTLHHELGHHFQIAKAGYPTQDIIGRLHKDIDAGAQAQARWDVSDFLDDKGKIDLGKVKDNIEALLDIFHGGAVADEVMRDVPVHRNSGARTDLRRMRTLLIDAGFAPSEAGQLMGASEGRVRADFTKPGIRDIFQRYSQAREAGLDPGLLMSEETSGRAIQDFKNALEAKESTGESENKQAASGKNQRGNPESNSGRTGGVQAGSKKANKPAGKTGESSGSGAGREERELIAAKDKEESSERLPKIKTSPPQERTTGEHDAAIKEAGAIPGGVQKGDPDIGLKDLVLFHDPITGSTLALPVDKVSPENVKKQIRESRNQYLAAEDRQAAKVNPDDYAKNHEGEQ